ncbi:MAG: DUF4249 family protein [Crocinitomicaceae bacterium]|nr:DUF4249 family protein [Crocinitomicaceae bacterium]
MKRLSFLLFVLLLSVMWYSCSTEVDLNAPYKSTTVVFGLLDPAADTQWIKINKTFLGDGNNLEYSLIRDSSEYDFSEFEQLAILEIVGGQVINTFPLQEKTIHNKEVNGIFYAPEQSIYYFATPLINGHPRLNEAADYQLVIDFYDRPDISAVTNVVKQGQISFIQPQPTSTISMAMYTGGGDVEYVKEVNVKWTAAENVVLYDFTLRFLYTEILNGVAENKFIDYKIGQYKNNNILMGQTLTHHFDGESFFSFLGNRLEKNPEIQRPIGFYDGTATRCFEMRMAMGNDELNTYNEVNSPVTGVIQERPGYTNIDGGIGLFASRSFFVLDSIRLMASGNIGGPQIGNLVALKSGNYTVGLNFCDPNPNNGEFSCN